MIECQWHDALREPRLLEPATNRHGLTLADLKDGEKCIILAGPCRFLIDTSTPAAPSFMCSIYPTRPNNCVGFPAGSDQCREARAREGLPNA